MTFSHFNLFTSPYFFSYSSGSNTKSAPLNINKVSSSLLSFGRKLIAPAISVSSSGVSPINSEIYSSSSPTSPPSPPPTLSHPLAEPSTAHAPSQTQSHTQSQHYRMLKSESMPVHLSKGEQQHTDGDLDLFLYTRIDFTQASHNSNGSSVPGGAADVN